MRSRPLFRACLLALLVLPPTSAHAVPGCEDLDLGPARAAAAEMPRLHSLLVSWRGELVLEHYGPAAGPTRLTNVTSVSKSVIAALVVRSLAGQQSCFAWGFGGQYIFTFPELDLVVVTSSPPDVSDERRGHRQMIFDLLERLIVPQFASPPSAALPLVRHW